MDFNPAIIRRALRDIVREYATHGVSSICSGCGNQIVGLHKLINSIGYCCRDNMSQGNGRNIAGTTFSVSRPDSRHKRESRKSVIRKSTLRPN